MTFNCLLWFRPKLKMVSPNQSIRLLAKIIFAVLRIKAMSVSTRFM